MFPPLNFPPARLRIRKEKKQLQVFDIIRKTYVALTPEEWVRQHAIHFLVTHKNFPGGLMEVEKKINLFNTDKRVDIFIRTPQLQPLLLVECKAPGIKLTQTAIDQLARYQITLKARFCILTNGNDHVITEFINEKPEFRNDLPDYSECRPLPFN